jgi:hypothetical protein
MADQVSSLKDLVASISKNATIIHNFLIANDRPQLSFAANVDQTLPTGPEYGQLQDARIELINQAKLLLDLTLGPSDALRHLPLPVSSQI